MILLALAAFFSEPAPLDMPRAEAYLVKENGSCRLEDRYVKIDLWTSRAVIGRWIDDDGRVFTVSRLEEAPPPVERFAAETRSDYTASSVKIEKDDLKTLRQAVECLSPVAPAEKPFSPRQGIRGYKDIDYWQGTNAQAVVCTFLPENGRWWYMASWELVDGDDISSAIGIFENKFLAADPGSCPDAVRAMEWKRRGFGDKTRSRRPRRAAPEPERELLRRDARHSVAAYADWRVTDSAEFVVLDALGGREDFISVMTNDLAKMRSEYRKALPSPIDGTNVLALARIYASRDDYLDAAGEDMGWTAAYWSPLRREVVAYLPLGNEESLLRTLRHEFFHQYLSYAASMISASPWLNEGYAQYFEDTEDMSWGKGITLTPEFVENAARMLPSLFTMGYEEFYSGDDSQRMLKYRLAWSVAWFIEHGACDVRFDPFKNLKTDYIRALIESRDMHKATQAAFGSDERRKLFIQEWVKYWKNPYIQ
jgi:hypothetical protein